MGGTQNEEIHNTSLAGEAEVTAPKLNGRSGGWSLVPQKDNGCINGKSEAISTIHTLDDDEDLQCGLGSCRPKWARFFASTNVFMVVFLLGWVFQGVFFTYFVSVITTIEKLFQIKSKTTGVMLAASEAGQIATALILPYFTGTGHRPRWIAIGIIMFSLGTMGCALPHFLFGNQLLASTQMIHGHENFSHSTMPGVCLTNYTDATKYSTCEDRIVKEQQFHSQITSFLMIIFVVCLLSVGVGQTAICTLGIPYIDDNVASKESPLYIAITIGVRIIGPAVGFILGSFCTRLYVTLSPPAGIQPSDPQWIGAWWLGMVLVSCSLFVMGLAMFCFPRRLPGSRSIQAQNSKSEHAQLAKPKPPYKTPQLKDFPKTLKRQLNNDILMLRTASSVLHLLPVAGLYTFLPKYLESQFRLPTHDANLVSGVGGILVMGVGILLSGGVILKFVPTAKFVSGWIAFTAIFYSLGMFSLIFVGCPMSDISGINTIAQDSRNYSITNQDYTTLYTTSACKSDCHCETRDFNVVCGKDGKTYFSPCHAGCKNVSIVNGTLHYYNCDCIVSSIYENWNASLKEYKAPPSLDSMAVGGYCTGNCNNFVYFVCIFSLVMFIHSTGEVGSILLIMRCTDPKDKAMAMGIIQFAIGLFGNVPCPIIFGVVVDFSCLIWDMVCGEKGACFLYDADSFRHFFLGTTGSIMFLAFIVDIIVWCKADKIDINPENDVSDVVSSKSVDCDSKPVALPQDLSTTPLTAIVSNDSNA